MVGETNFTPYQVIALTEILVTVTTVAAADN
jgi:hypothetical protein